MSERSRRQRGIPPLHGILGRHAEMGGLEVPRYVTLPIDGS